VLSVYRKQEIAKDSGAKIFITEDFMKKKKALWMYAALAIGGAMWFAGCEAMMEILGFGSVAEADEKEEDAIAGGGAKDQSPLDGEGGENPPGIEDDYEFDPEILSFYVSGGGNDSNSGLTEAEPFKTLSHAYAAALADTNNRKRIVVLSSLDVAAAVVFDAENAADGTVTVSGQGGGIEVRRTGGNDSVLEIRNGALVAFENITIDGKVGGAANRALLVDGANTKVTLGNGAALTGKKTGGSGVAEPSDADGSGILITGCAEVVMAEGSSVAGCETDGSNYYVKGAVVVKGIDSSHRSKLTMAGGVISNNTVTVNSSGTNTAYGGGVYLWRGKLEMGSGGINGNTVSVGGTSNDDHNAYGGGVYCYYSEFVMTGGTVSGNKAVSDVGSSSSSALGGGVNVSNGGSFKMSAGAIISDNEASSTKGPAYGGGVYLFTGTFEMSGGAVSGNKASTNAASGTARGGGLFQGNGTFTMTGGVIYGSEGSVDMSLKNTVDGNTVYGAAYHKSSGTATVNGVTQATSENTLGTP
jgi:hypothetical protein